jgi:hypothetical protein
MKWVIITSGPEWAIGKTAKWDGEYLTFYSDMDEPHWYTPDNFTMDALALDGSDTDMAAQLEDAGFGSFGPM